MDINAGNEFVAPAASLMAGLGSFGGLFDLQQTGFKDPILVSGTDGVGTKLKVCGVAGQCVCNGVEISLTPSALGCIFTFSFVYD